MENKKLIMVGYHEETRDNKGKLIMPASLFKIYEEKGKDCLGEEYFATCQQVYARKNKKIKSNNISIDDFKGSKGIAEEFYEIDGIIEFLEMIIDDGYRAKRITNHTENELADKLFNHVLSYEISQMGKVMQF